MLRSQMQRVHGRQIWAASVSAKRAKRAKERPDFGCRGIFGLTFRAPPSLLLRHLQPGSSPPQPHSSPRHHRYTPQQLSKSTDDVGKVSGTSRLCSTGQCRAHSACRRSDARTSHFAVASAGTWLGARGVSSSTLSDLCSNRRVVFQHIFTSVCDTQAHVWSESDRSRRQSRKPGGLDDRGDAASTARIVQAPQPVAAHVLGCTHDVYARIQLCSRTSVPRVLLGDWVLRTPITDPERFAPSRLVPAYTDPSTNAPTKRIRVTFNADASDAIPWSFTPQQKEIYVLPGETALAFYTAKNKSTKDIIGIATYNVSPDRVSPFPKPES